MNTSGNSAIKPIEGIVWPPVNDASSAKIASLIAQLDASEKWSAQKIAKTQLRQLTKICQFARNATTFYAERFAHIDMDDENGINLEDFRTVPVVTRSDIQDRFRDMVSTDTSMETGPPQKFNTSGSTSSPVTVLISKTMSDMVTALQIKWYKWGKLDGNKTLGELRSYSYEEGRDPIVRKKHWHYSFPEGENEKVNISLPFEDKIDWLQKTRPNYICTYPSLISELLQYAGRHNLDLSFIEKFITYGEAPIAGLDELAAKICGATIFDKYSSREAGAMALQCPETGLMHVQTDNVLLEVIKDNGEPANEGEEGKIIITSLLNTAMPIIRYEIGDRAIVGPTCSCGRKQPTLRAVLGRERNFFKTKDGNSIRPFTNIADMQTFSQIRQFQFIQTDYEDVVFKYVSDAPLSEETLAALEASNNIMFPVKYNISYIRVDEIPRSKGGKFEDMICEIKD